MYPTAHVQTKQSNSVMAILFKVDVILNLFITNSLRLNKENGKGD